MLASAVLVVGWMTVRPDPAPPTGAATAMLPGKSSPRSASPGPSAADWRGIPPFLGPGTFISVDDEQMLTGTRTRYVETLEWRAGVLAEQLSLLPDQRERLRLWQDEVAAKFADETTMATLQEAGRLLGQGALESFLTTLLDESQARAFSEFKRQERENCVDSMLSFHLERMAEIAGMREDQRAGITGALASDVEAVATFRVDNPPPPEYFNGKPDQDPQALGLESLIRELVGNEPARLYSDIPRQIEFRKELRARIEARLEALGPVLDQTQLSKYREHLEKNWAISWQTVLLPPLDPPR